MLNQVVMLQDIMLLLKVRFGKRVFMKKTVKSLKGDDGEGADGFRLKFKITKNKTCACNRGGGFITYKYERPVLIL